MSGLNEHEHWKLFVDGDLNALSVIFHTYVAGMMAYGLKICHDEELVKDAVQEVFIKLIRKRERINPDNHVRGLVYRLLRNQLIDEIKLIDKKRSNDQLFASFDDCCEFDAEQIHIALEDEHQRSSLLSSAIDKLSSHQKEIMFLKFSNGLSYEEIALS